MQQKLEGTLWKWTNYWNGWQPRWFVLDKGFLSYYKSEDEVSLGCKGAINIAASIVKGHPSDPYRLDVVVPGEQHFYLRAGSPHERQNWLVALGSVKSSVNSEKASKVLDEASRLKRKHCEVRLYCDLLIQQVHQIKSLVVDSPIPDVNKLDETTSLLSETCDTFINTIEELMKMANPNSPIIAPPIVYPFPTVSNGPESPTLALVHSPTRSTKDIVAQCSPTGDVVSGDNRKHSKDSSSFGETSTKPKTPTGQTNKPSSVVDHDIPTFFTVMDASFANIIVGVDGSVPTVAFLESSSSLTKIFDVLSATAFAPVKMDLNGNIRKLYQKYESDPSSYKTLQLIVQSEIDKGTTNAANSASDALLWLKRGVGFVREFLMCFNEGEPNLTECAGKAYGKTLKQYHNWVVRGIFTLAAKAAPHREDFVATLAVRQEDVGTEKFHKKLRSDVTSYIAGIDRSLKPLAAFYATNKLFEDAK